MITVHHLENSRSLRILWMLEELDLPYEIKHYKRLPTMQAPPDLKAVHPLGKSPAITDDGVTLAESGAILEYLVQKYGNGRFVPPLGSEEWRRYTYFMHYAEGSLMPVLLLKLLFSRIIPSRVPALLRPVGRLICDGADRNLISPQLATNFAFLESELANRDWFAGSAFSAADVQMSYPLEAAATRAGLGDRFPKLQGFLDRNHARPAYKRAVERGGALALLK
jgi:glutathione S-transferase